VIFPGNVEKLPDVTRSSNPVKWLAVRTRQNGKLLNSQRIIKCYPSCQADMLAPRPSVYRTLSLQSSPNSHRRSREHYKSVTPLRANISSLVEGPRISRRGTGLEGKETICPDNRAKRFALFTAD